MSSLDKTGYRLHAAAVVVCMFILIETGDAAEIRLKSSVEPVTVVELFTSHGCSSCPPADAWLRRLSSHKDLWSGIIPMAFHVDYWDYLGWHDRFARPEYSSRQRDYRRSGRIGVVYTPEFVVNGREWRGWLGTNGVNLSSEQKVGTLEARVVPEKKIMVRFTPVSDIGEQRLVAHVAVLGFDLNSRIGGGENSGRTLAEDFVVLGTSSASSNTEMKWNLPWPEVRYGDTERKAVVIWVSLEDDPAPIQAVGGWLN